MACTWVCMTLTSFQAWNARCCWNAKSALPAKWEYTLWIWKSGGGDGGRRAREANDSLDAKANANEAFKNHNKYFTRKRTYISLLSVFPHLIRFLPWQYVIVEHSDINWAEMKTNGRGIIDSWGAQRWKFQEALCASIGFRKWIAFRGVSSGTSPSFASESFLPIGCRASWDALFSRRYSHHFNAPIPVDTGERSATHRNEWAGGGERGHLDAYRVPASLRAEWMASITISRALQTCLTNVLFSLVSESTLSDRWRAKRCTKETRFGDTQKHLHL